jgi:hypothetical protein
MKIYFDAVFSYCRENPEYQDKGVVLAYLTKAPPFLPNFSL